MAGFAVDRFGARPILAGGLLALGIWLALFALAGSFPGFAAIAVLGGLGNSRVPSRRLRAAECLGRYEAPRPGLSIHGLGGSLGWAAGPAIYFLDDRGRSDRMPPSSAPCRAWCCRYWSWVHRYRRSTTASGARGCRGRRPSPWSLFLQPSILLCFAFFALVAANTVGIQQFAVPALSRCLASARATRRSA